MSTMIPHRFSENGSRIRKAREAAGFSQEKFAETVGTTRRHMIRLENGEHLPQSTLRDRIAETAGVDPATLDASDDDEEAASMQPLSGDEFAMLGTLMSRLGASIPAPASLGPVVPEPVKEPT